MTNYCLILFALLLPMQRFPGIRFGYYPGTAKANPMSSAESGVHQRGDGGLFVRRIRRRNGSRKGSGKTYKVKTDKKGSFSVVGMEYGVYQIEITAVGRPPMFILARKISADNTDAASQNTLNVDLSLAISGPMEPGGGTNLASGKENKRNSRN